MPVAPWWPPTDPNRPALHPPEEDLMPDEPHDATRCALGVDHALDQAAVTLHTFSEGRITFTDVTGETITVPFESGEFRFFDEPAEATGAALRWLAGEPADRIIPTGPESFRVTITKPRICWWLVAMFGVRNPPPSVLRAWWLFEGRRWRGTRLAAVREGWRRGPLRSLAPRAMSWSWSADAE